MPPYLGCQNFSILPYHTFTEKKVWYALIIKTSYGGSPIEEKLTNYQKKLHSVEIAH